MEDLRGTPMSHHGMWETNSLGWMFLITLLLLWLLNQSWDIINSLSLFVDNFITTELIKCSCRASTSFATRWFWRTWRSLTLMQTFDRVVGAFLVCWSDDDALVRQPVMNSKVRCDYNKAEVTVIKETKCLTDDKIVTYFLLNWNWVEPNRHAIKQ